MIPIRLTRGLDGRIVFENLPAWLVALLRELDDLLEDDQSEEADARLFPMPSDDPEHREEWRRLVHPDLFALRASAREVVELDLADLEASVPPDVGFRLEIPEPHVHAWIHALNSARLTLAETHGIGQAELEDSGVDLPDERSFAVQRIHVLGHLQSLMIGGRYPEIDCE